MSGWEPGDIPSQEGRSAVVTGANSGIGLVAARELTRAGATVICACRNTEKGESAADGIRDAVPGAKVEVRRLDLADLASVREFADGVTDPLDLLVNNAGVMATPRRKTADGFELQLGTNHFGHFALTGLLLGRLMAGTDPRVVTVSSTAHRTGRMNFDNLDGDRRYFRWAAYGQSKLANLLFAYELERRQAQSGAGVPSMAAHPGYAATNLQTAGQFGGGIASLANRAVMAVANRTVAQSDEAGALPTLYAATFPNLPGGSFIGPDGPKEFRGAPRVVDSNEASKSESDAARLWEVSEERTGVVYDFGRS